MRQNRIDEVLTVKSEIVDPEKPETLEKKEGVVRFNHVSFKYPGAEHNALEDIVLWLNRVRQRRLSAVRAVVNQRL